MAKLFGGIMSGKHEHHSALITRMWLLYVGVWYYFKSRSREIRNDTIMGLALIGAGTSFCFIAHLIETLFGVA